MWKILFRFNPQLCINQTCSFIRNLVEKKTAKQDLSDNKKSLFEKMVNIENNKKKLRVHSIGAGRNRNKKKPKRKNKQEKTVSMKES